MLSPVPTPPLFIGENCWLLIAVSSSNYFGFTVIIPRYLYTYTSINIYTRICIPLLECSSVDIPRQSRKSSIQFNKHVMRFFFTMLFQNSMDFWINPRDKKILITINIYLSINKFVMINLFFFFSVSVLPIHFSSAVSHRQFENTVSLFYFTV